MVRPRSKHSIVPTSRTVRMLNVLRKQMAFIERGFIVDTSYKLDFAQQLVTSLLPLVSFFFLGRLVGGESAQVLDRYGGEYYPFAFVGIALTQFLNRALGTFGTSIQRAQATGVLEAVLSTKTSPAAVVLLDATYSFLLAGLHLTIVVAVASWGFGVSFVRADWSSVAVIGVLSLMAFSGLGILSAVAIVLFKRGDPVRMLMGPGGGLLAGALFPTSLLPGWLQVIASCLPTTHALELMRLALLQGATLAELERPLSILAGMAVTVLPVSVWAFDRAVEKGRRDGSLLHY